MNSQLDSQLSIENFGWSFGIGRWKIATECIQCVCMNFVIGLHYSLKSHDIFVFGLMLAMTFLKRIFSLYMTLCPCVRMWCSYIGVTFNIKCGL